LTSTSAYLTAAALLDSLFEHPQVILASAPQEESNGTAELSELFRSLLSVLLVLTPFLPV
jgi:hypothetical protein